MHLSRATLALGRCCLISGMLFGFILLSNDSLAGEGDPAAAHLVVKNVSIFDSVTGKLQQGQSILVRGERIVAVDAAENLKIPAEATVIDGQGKFVIPGLIDAHVHLVHVLDYAKVTGVEVLPLFLAAGVTAVRSTGDEVVAETAVAHFAARSPHIAPDVFTCSPLIDADPVIHRDIGRPFTDPGQIPSFLDEMLGWKVTTLKIYAGSQRAIGKAVIEEGHRRGFVVTGHLGAYSAQDAVADGIDCIEHITSAYYFIMPPEETSKPLPERNVNNGVTASLAAEMKQKNVVIDPTLAVFRNMILLSDKPEIYDHPDNALVPKRLRDFWPQYLKQAGLPNGPLENRTAEFRQYEELTGVLHRAGVTVLVGTDAPEPNVPPGFSLHQELEMLVESGLTPAEALTAATLKNSTILRQEKECGSIQPGKQADLVILDANPLEDIRNTRKIHRVVHRGRISDPEELLKLVPKE